jgi:8-oxo-dGTP pyrophosphatase MutT (NUDIX family)
MLRESPHDPELLMVRRRAGDAFGDSYAFPGGVLDADESLARGLCAGVDSDAANALLKVSEGGLDYFSAAIRELFEETGVLLARHGDDWVADSPLIQKLRNRVDKAALAWPDFLRDQDLQMAGDAVHYFAHWETPLNRPKRWSTRFFLAQLPAGQNASHDDGELTEIKWLTAAEALSAGLSGNMKLPFPTIKNLQALAEFNTVDALVEWARQEARNGIEKIRPVELSGDGKHRFVIPGDRDYP